MEDVHLVHGHEVEKTTDEVFVEEVACDVHHYRAVGHARCVYNTHLSSIHKHSLYADCLLEQI